MRQQRNFRTTSYTSRRWPVKSSKDRRQTRIWVRCEPTIRKPTTLHSYSPIHKLIPTLLPNTGRQHITTRSNVRFCPKPLWRLGGLGHILNLQSSNRSSTALPLHHDCLSKLANTSELDFHLTVLGVLTHPQLGVSRFQAHTCILSQPKKVAKTSVIFLFVCIPPFSIIFFVLTKSKTMKDIEDMAFY